MKPINIDAVNHDVSVSLSNVPKRQKTADAIRMLRPVANMSNITSSTDRCILDNVIATSNATASTPQHSRKRGSCISLAPPPKRRELIFQPGPRLARRIALFDDQAV